MMDSFNIEAECFTIEEVFQINSYPSSITVSGIHRAVLENNLEAAKCLVNLGKSLNAKEEHYGCTPLHLAVLKNRVEILDHFLTRDDIELNVRCVRGYTPLCLASELGAYESVKKLIDAGVDVNIPDNNSASPLHLSTEFPEMCHLLTLHGANIDEVDCHGLTPMFNAVYSNHLETVDVLLYHNADPNKPDDRGMTPFIQALISERIEAQSALLEYVDDFNVSYSDDVDSGTLIELALEYNSPFIAEMIERGADVNQYNDEGYCGAFVKCVYGVNDPTVFKVVWERLRCFKRVDLSQFFYDLDGDLLASYIQVIIDSDNVGLAVESLTKHDNFHLFVSNFLYVGLDVRQLVVLTYRLLEYGYRPNFKDVHNVFYEYGDGELSRVLLHMDINCRYPYYRLDSILGIRVRVLFLLGFDARTLADELDSDAYDFAANEVLEVLNYFRHPRLINIFRLRFSDKCVSEILNNLPKVPSLVELARDQARTHILGRFQVTSLPQFYNIIDRLSVAPLHRDILTYRKEIY